MGGAADFEIAAGSVKGREHARAGRNNQDAFAIQREGDVVAAVICDGCGSAPHSEVGAKIISRCTVRALCELGWSPKNARENLAVVQALVCDRLRTLASSMGEPERVAREYFLATVVGALITGSTALVFSLGDGVILHNGRKIVLEYPDNAPPYLAHPVMGGPCVPFTIHSLGSPASLDFLVLASDGAVEIDRLAESWLPGKRVRVGSLRQFVDGSQFFENPSAVQRRLRLMNRPGADPDTGLPIPGRLGDDTTLIAIRRKPENLRACAPTSPASDMS